MRKITIAIVISYCFMSLRAEQQIELASWHSTTWATQDVEDQDALWRAKLRARTLLKLDKMLDWAFPAKDRSYQKNFTKTGYHYTNPIDHMTEFSKTFSYFSKKRPVISTVTQDQEDLMLASRLLTYTYQHCQNEEFLELATAEILSKVVAFRSLKEGMILSLPVVLSDGSRTLIDYEVDKVIKMWPGMPAFGLRPLSSQGNPILLFRGTDLSLESRQGWASVLSDLDIQGPGLTAFQNSRKEIHDWLTSHVHQGKKVKVMGFSLGGVLALYTFIFEREWISDEGSYAFNPPGISSSTFKKWEEIPPQNRHAIKVLVTYGDLIPKMGKLAGDVYELSLDFSLKPVDAHVRLMCCQPSLYLFSVDLHEENLSRR